MPKNTTLRIPTRILDISNATFTKKENNNELLKGSFWDKVEHYTVKKGLRKSLTLNMADATLFMSNVAELGEQMRQLFATHLILFWMETEHEFTTVLLHSGVFLRLHAVDLLSGAYGWELICSNEHIPRPSLLKSSRGTKTSTRRSLRKGLRTTSIGVSGENSAVILTNYEIVVSILKEISVMYAFILFTYAQGLKAKDVTKLSLHV